MSAHQISRVVGTPADVVFETLTDLERLPEWNAVIVGVVERPPTLAPHAEWVVELQALGQRWRSRSTVLENDLTAHRTTYESRTDDGNPSWTDWSWTVSPVDDRTCEVTVAWTLHAKTFWRRVLLSHIRARQLRREVSTSVARLVNVASAANTEPVD